jgi:hypothetical protein
LDQLRVARYCATAYENEREAFQVKLKEDNVKIKREKDQLLVEKTAVKEVVNKELCSVIGST